MEKLTKLHHKYGEKKEEFFQRIDEFGGWPVGKRYVGFEHSEQRFADFTDEYVSGGWWSTICAADDYYYWKVSQEFKNRIRKEIINGFLLKSMQ